jgi:hypothetical protein
MEVSTVKLFHTDKTNKDYISSVELLCSTHCTGLGFVYWFTATRSILLELTVGAQVTGVTLQWGRWWGRGEGFGRGGKPTSIEERKGQGIL